jgi:uncharacterized glyoxalase superfamily protein PhnB
MMRLNSSGNDWRSQVSTETRNAVSIQSISPYLFYEDAAAAMDWLELVFGFQEDVRYVDSDGIVQEAEMLAGETRLMIGGKSPDPDEGPGQLFIVHVDDVDAQYQRVRSAGVDAESPVEMPYGPKTFTVQDPWGYRWSFWQMVKREIELPEGWREIRP